MTVDKSIFRKCKNSSSPPFFNSFEFMWPFQDSTINPYSSVLRTHHRYTFWTRFAALTQIGDKIEKQCGHIKVQRTARERKRGRGKERPREVRENRKEMRTERECMGIVCNALAGFASSWSSACQALSYTKTGGPWASQNCHYTI